MKRGCFRVSPFGTDVMGIVAHSGAPVGRCVSSADTSLSLSLSLCPGLLGSDSGFGARRGVSHDLPAGTHRAFECGVRRSRQAAQGLFERRCHPHLAPAFEEAPAHAHPTRAGSVSAERRGHNPRPRRSPSAVGRLRLSSGDRALNCDLSFVPVHVTPGFRTGRSDWALSWAGRFASCVGMPTNMAGATTTPSVSQWVLVSNQDDEKGRCRLMRSIFRSVLVGCMPVRPESRDTDGQQEGLRLR